MLLVADVHAAFDALRRVADEGEAVLVLGDLVNLVDYRTTTGIIPDVVGTDVVHEVVDLRARGAYDEANAAWRRRADALGIDVRQEVGDRMRVQYEAMASALAGAHAYVTYGNVDQPSMLREYLPTGVRYVDAEVVEIEGVPIGFAGGGVQRIGSRGEVTDDDMRDKLDTIGPVDVLCTHVPPAIPMLAEDVIASPTKGSAPILEYIRRHQPRYHFFGDVHQPRALRWQLGRTTCVNVGYFRATGRPYRFEPIA